MNLADQTVLALSILGAAACVVGLVLSRLKSKAEKEAQEQAKRIAFYKAEAKRAEDACEELRKALMQGVEPLRHTRPNPHKWTDEVVEVIRVKAAGRTRLAAFRDAAWRDALKFGEEVAREAPFLLFEK